MTTPHTIQRNHQHRGPTDSADYNERIETEHQDFSYLYNADQANHSLANDSFSMLLRNQLGLARALAEFRERVAVLEADNSYMTLSDPTQFDVTRFDSTSFEVQLVDRATYDNRHGVLTLPEVSESSLSKLVFVSGDGTVVVPSTLETRVEGVTGTADSVGAVIDSNEPENAVARAAGRVWERNVVVNGANVNGAEAYFYIKTPTDLFTTEFSNTVVMHPYPMFGVDVLEVAYTTNPDVLLDDADGYTPLNEDQLYLNDTEVVGWVPPGGWDGDEVINSGPKVYHFDPKHITGIRFHLRQPNYYLENGKHIYAYGMSLVDLRYNKFLDSGTTIIRMDAPDGATISSVDDVIPFLWNVPEALYGEVFDYRVIWETAFNSDTYTLTPVPLSQRVWIEITLHKTPGGGTPALTGLVVDFS